MGAYSVIRRLMIKQLFCGLLSGSLCTAQDIGFFNFSVAEIKFNRF